MNYLLSILVLFFLFQEINYSSERRQMVDEQIKARGISHEATLKAMNNVERHQFVPAHLKRHAYSDHPLPIGSGQTISQPYIVAFMTSSFLPDEKMKVLEIGTGSGYQAAVLAEIVNEVYTIEIVPELENKAGHLLDSLEYENINIKQGDGYNGWEEYAPFDAIIVTAALDHIPPPLIDQLTDSGELIMPVGSRGRIQSLKLLTKKGNKTEESNLMPVRFVPFTRYKKKD